MEYLDANNAKPKAFIWTASTQTILSKVRQANEALETLRQSVSQPATGRVSEASRSFGALLLES